VLIGSVSVVDSEVENKTKNEKRVHLEKYKINKSLSNLLL